ncbi:platelet-activating factor acetylhydrolase IB subunit gamma [Folsomia candida]|uniref:Platelet-activating factor acetylhydrolase IB subunit gamma n=1 Tax=Folsomia candida TaxID=158441 RepID=A0A226EG06_FOLCA|nr:platelet-activating factor acetylhydrolase IB subunit gamma [Folsomia candida]OXA55994.1 Platelet-activating factor acetylhydrolase IB subunit gamma [Folsomia candida]
MHKSIPVPTQARGRRGSLFKERLLLVSPEIAFIGDSILAKFAEDGQAVWEKNYSHLNSGNMGTVGDSTQMLIEKLERDMLPLEDTQIVVLMIGATDLRHKLKVSVVFDQIRKIIQMLQAGCRSGVKIMILGVLPRGDSNVDCNDAIAETNEMLTNLENGFTMRFVTLQSQFYDKEKNKIREELFHTDRINLNEKGYEVLANAIHPVLQEFLQSK